MIRWIQRFCFALCGGALGALLVAVLEARAAIQTVSAATAPSFVTLVLGDFGALAPFGLLVGGLVAAGSVFLEPTEMRTLAEHVRAVRTQPLLTRSRTAAFVPLVMVASFLWCVAVAHLARHVLAEGEPVASGLKLGAAALGELVAFMACAFALTPVLRRGLAAGAAKTPAFIDPVVTTALGVVVVGIGLAVGVATGDESGVGATPLAIFGVLKRGELDLRPVFYLLVIAAFAYLVPMTLSTFRRQGVLAVAAIPFVLASLLVTYKQAHGMNEKPVVAAAIERGAPLGKIALGTLRKLTDRDHDGFSPLFAGGDCDDKNPDINPNAFDIPGNGIDEDCSGEDTPLPAPAVIVDAGTASSTGTPEPSGAPHKAIDKDLNLIFITVDTLRPDVGFMGYTANRTTPNLDNLAARSVVYDRAYSMASYTGKALAPILIGKYPSETMRDGGHFNRYYPQNVFVAERLKKAGIKTMGAGTHWYFNESWGLAKGMDIWDTSAIPRDGQGQEDTSVTSPALTDLALKLLGKKENTDKRFFLWLHYFDPHAQYVPHPEVASFPLGPNNVTAMRAMYDGEIAFTDHHIGRLLDFIATQPWGDSTAIVLTSDHGEAFLEHKMAYHGIEIWDELVRVPLVVYVPGVTPHHVPLKRSHIDIVPTILELMRVPLPPAGELSGVSLVPEVLAGEGAEYEERDVLVDMPDGPNTKMRRAIIHGKTPGKKLIHYGGTKYELYDLSADPGETVNLAQDEEAMRDMKAALLAKKAQLKEIVVKADEPGY